jgi:hypothetical protein
MSDSKKLNNNFSNSTLDLSINNTYSIFISSYIAYFNPLIRPLIIIFDSSNKTSLYYSLYIQNKLLLINQKYMIINIDIKDLFDVNKLKSDLFSELNTFSILDCIYDIDNLMTFIQTNLQNKIIIQKIYTILNYYNITEEKLKLFYDLFLITEYINIINTSLFNQLNNQYVDELVFKDLDQQNLLSTFVISNDKTLNRFEEIKNYFIIQSISDYYKIYFLKYNLNNAFIYILRWSYFDKKLITYINSFDTFDNLINYQIINFGSIVCQNYLEDIKMKPFLSYYPIRFISNYNNILSIDEYKMDSYEYKKKLGLIFYKVIYTSNFSDSIYKLDGNIFEPIIIINELIPETLEYKLKLKTSTNAYDICLIGSDLIELEIIDNLDIYKCIIFLQLKYDLLKDIDNEYQKMDDFYIQILIIAKKQYCLKRYIIVNNELLIDTDIDINIWYNPSIKKGNYRSQIFFNDLIIYYNIMS